jgi:hypothetical protein
MKHEYNYEFSANSSTSHMMIMRLTNEVLNGEKHIVMSAGSWDLENNDLVEYIVGLEPDLKVNYASSAEAVVYGSNDWFALISFRMSSYADPYYQPTSCVASVAFHARTYQKAFDMAHAFDIKFEPDKVDENTNTNWASLNPKGEISYTTLNLKKFETFYPEFYPYIRGGDVDGYIDDFIKSKSSILILIGDPGLGKSSLINYLLQRAKWSSVVAYDEYVMSMDSFYIDFVSSHRKAMILEDADILLAGRAEAGNKTMSKILNVSDGIIDSGKKYIFSANLQNISDIDDALRRPGRCFDILNFRPLNKDEALVAAKAIGKDLPFQNTRYTMAEIFNSKSDDDNVVSIRRKVGFT